MKPFDLRPILIYFLILILSVLMIVLTSCKKELPIEKQMYWVEISNGIEYVANYDCVIMIDDIDIGEVYTVIINDKTYNVIAEVEQGKTDVFYYGIKKGNKYSINSSGKLYRYEL